MWGRKSTLIDRCRCKSCTFSFPISNWRQFRWSPAHCISPISSMGESWCADDEGNWDELCVFLPARHLCRLLSLLSFSLSAPFPAFISLHLSQFGWTIADIPLRPFPCISTQACSGSLCLCLLPECALLHSEPFDVIGNSWLREIWWKVSRPVFTPSQMALNKLGGEDANTLFSEGLNLEYCFGWCVCFSVVSGTLSKPALKSESRPVWDSGTIKRSRESKITVQAEDGFHLKWFTVCVLKWTYFRVYAL